MIRNRLSELLSERGLKISRVAKEVGIARSSLTSMVQNDSEMVRYDAIDKLCKYLNVSPNDFFEYMPISIEYTFDEEPNVEYSIDYNFDNKLVLDKFVFDFLVDVNAYGKSETFDLEVKFMGFEPNEKTNFKISNESNTEKLKEVVNYLTPGLKNVLHKRIQKQMQSYVTEYLLEDIENNSSFSIPKSDMTRLKKAFEKAPVNLISNIFTEY
ncbi:helix-turn-helix transcriptional regulator [Staphylococcus warneri]|uniref:helix-turn-helix domain-containing protein n=1 Tax=Staphylococcus TaxID=1279 RepID=UPI00031C59DF|nr:MULTISPECIES: helix-turn-helix transcriptional regulator [Staphylococcus]KAB2269569.1 helix-turn-helix transcriptional regulator [Staphylococcus epidermidis]MBU5608713.1 helix-turn-helix transcriptional regulator [Staphylococcus epidermidis]MCD8805073.1 helix-turn-helix transcriptional regulator [Staphylococcus warneri]MCD8807401.1 helix-turn-helix transcriptional regulator [Staphylococcus warneri]MCO6234802.1 helix-turn-helix transcriptional regulator [Staphylococcus epidermidis]